MKIRKLKLVEIYHSNKDVGIKDNSNIKKSTAVTKHQDKIKLPTTGNPKKKKNKSEIGCSGTVSISFPINQTHIVKF